MRPKTSIMVMRRLKAVRKLAVAIRNPMPGVLEGLEKFFGEALPGGQRTFELLADGLLRELDWLVAIDQRKFAAENEEETARREVRDAAAALYAQTVKTRDSIVGAFGRKKARTLIQGRVSRIPDQLRAQVEPIVHFLGFQAGGDGPEEAKAAGFLPKVHHKELETLSEKLLTAQVDLKNREDATSIARDRWTDALDLVDDACRSAIKTAEGLHELAGVDARLGSFRKAIRKRAYEKRQNDEESDLAKPSTTDR